MISLLATSSPLVDALLVAELLLGLLVVLLATFGYRRNGSRPMLFLAAGIGSITLLSPLAGALAGNLFAIGSVVPASRSVSVLGLCLVLVSIVLARDS